MTDKTDARQASMVTVAIAKVLDKSLWHSMAVPPALFVLESSLVGVFKGEDNMEVECQAPQFSASVDPLMVDMTGTNRFFQVVFESFFQCPSVLMASREFKPPIPFPIVIIIKPQAPLLFCNVILITNIIYPDHILVFNPDLFLDLKVKYMIRISSWSLYTYTFMLPQ